MKHPSSRDVFAYWTKQRGERPAPTRSEIDPGAIRYALADTFMLTADFVETQRFRLAGTRVCALFSRELKGEPFTELWSEASRNVIGELLNAITAENIGIVAGLSGRAEDGDAVDLELLLLPLAHEGHARIRAIGVLAGKDLPYWIGQKPVKELELVTLRHVSPALDKANARRFIVSRSGGEMRRVFIVYQGGLMAPPNEKAS